MAVFTYGLSTTDYVEVADVYNPPQRPPSGTVLSVTDYTTGLAVTGLTDASGTPIASVATVDVYGSLAFRCESPAVRVSGDGGVTYKVMFGVEALAAASAVGDLSAQVSAAAASAASAASAAQAAATAAAAAVPLTARGAAGGVASLDAVGDIPVTQIPQAVLDDVASALAGAGGGGGGVIPLQFEHKVTDGSLVAGDVSKSYPVRVACTMALGPVVDLDDYGTTSSVFDVGTVVGASFTSLYSGAKPTVATGATTVTAAAPTTQSIPAGSRLASKVVSVAPPGAAGGSAAVIGGTVNAASGADQRTAGGATTVAFTVPAGAVTDAVVVYISAPGADTITTPTGWTLLGSQSSGALTHVTLWVYAAQWSSGLTGTFAVSGTSNAHGHAVLVTNANASALGQLTFGVLGESSLSVLSTYQSPAWTASEAYDVGLIMLATRWSPALDGWRPTWASGPTGTTEVGDSLSHRGAATIDVGGAVAKFGPAASGSTPTQANITFTYTAYAGSVSTTTPSTGTAVAAVLGIKRAPGSHGPSQALCHYLLQVA